MQAQGSMGQLLTCMEPAFNTAPTAASPNARKLYIKSESFGFSQELSSSDILRGGNRQPTSPVRGNTNVQGGISSEVNAMSMLFHAACGDMTTTQTGGTFSTSAGTVTTAVIAGQFCTVTFSGTHSLTGANIGDPVVFAGATGAWATPMNSKVYAIIDVPSTTSIKLRVQFGLTEGTVAGTVTISKYTSGTALYTHTIKAGGNLASYIIDKGFTDIGQYFKYAGCKCGSLNFALGASGLFELSTDWMGAGETTGTSALATTPLDPGKSSFDGLGITSANFLYQGTAIAVNVPQTFDIKIDNGLDGDSYVIGGSGVRKGINPGTLKATGSFKGIFETLSAGSQGYDLYANAKAGTACAFDITCVKGTGTGALNNESLQIKIDECLLKPKAPSISGPKGVMMDFEYEAYYNSGATGAAIAFIIKTTAGPGAML